MTSTVRVSLDDRSYEITIGDGALTRAGDLIRAALGSQTRRVALISNPRVDQLYGKIIERSLRRAGFAVRTHLIGDGEAMRLLRSAAAWWEISRVLWRRLFCEA